MITLNQAKLIAANPSAYSEETLELALEILGSANIRRKQFVADLKTRTEEAEQLLQRRKRSGL